MSHRRFFRIALLAMTMALVMAVLLIAPFCAGAQGTDPESVIRAVMDALNAQDVDAALALVADDAVVTVGQTFTGKEEIRAYWEGWVAGNGYTEVSNFQVDGERATFSAKASDDEFRAMGVDSIDATGEGDVQRGLLKGWTITMTDESMAKVGAAMAALPETGVPMSSGFVFPTDAWAAALGGVAILGGVGLGLLRRRSYRR